MQCLWKCNIFVSQQHNAMKMEIFNTELMQSYKKKCWSMWYVWEKVGVEWVKEILSLAY